MLASARHGFRTGRPTIADVASSLRPFSTHLLIWASLIGGWLVLGALGSTRMPLQAGGLAPIAAWLAAAGLTRHVLGVRRTGGISLYSVIVVASLVAVFALIDGDGPFALLVAAIAWGVSLAASSCALLPDAVMRAPAGRRRPSDGPSAWVSQSARWSMLPMMASLTFMSQWCGDAWGITASAAIGLHLGAMTLPALFLRRLRIDARADTGIAIAMAAGVVATFALPVLQALMVASLCQSAAFSLAWASRSPAPIVRTVAPGARAWFVACVPACCIWAFGSALANSGPLALLDVQRGLGLLAVVGTLASVFNAGAPTVKAGS